MYNTVVTDQRIIRKRYILCKTHLVFSTIIYLLVWVFHLEAEFGLMICYGVFSILMTSLLLKSEMRYGGISLLILFLAGSYLRLQLPTVMDALLVINGGKFSFKYDYTDALFPCAIAMNIYYMMFIVLLTKFSKTNRIISIDLSPLLNKRHLMKTILFLFAWGTLYGIKEDIFSIGFLGMFLDGFSPMALVMLAFVSVYKPEKKYRYTFYVLVIIEVLRSAIFGFYKGAIIKPIFIFAIHYFLSCRYSGKSLITVKSATLSITAVLFLLVFVYPFMNAKRYAAGWDPTNGITQQIDIKDIKELVVTIFENKDKFVDDGQSDAMFDRFDALKPNAYFYKLVQLDGVNPIILYGAIRQFWPKWLGRDTSEDTLLKPGYIATSYIEYGYLRRIDSFSSSYTGAFASGYFWGWWIGVFIVCLFNAWTLSYFLKFCTVHYSNYLSLLILTSIITEAFGCFEEVHSGGLSRALLWFIYVIVFYLYVSYKKYRNV